MINIHPCKKCTLSPSQSINLNRMSPEEYSDTFWAMLRDAIDQVGENYPPRIYLFSSNRYLFTKHKHSFTIHRATTFCQSDADPPPWLLQTNLLWADVQCCVQVSDFTVHLFFCTSISNMSGVSASSTVKFSTGTCSTTWGSWYISANKLNS